MNTKHATFFVLMLSFFLINGLSVLYLTGQTTATGREIYVDDSFSYPRDGTAEHPYQTISEAINLANDGDSIYVFSGTYNESLTINKHLSLIGGIDDQPSIISYGAELKYAVDITTDSVTLENFVIQDKGRHITSQYGALVHVTANNVVLQKNNISSCDLWGIYLDSSDGNTISGNVINHTKGVFVSSSNNNVFSSNNISNSSFAGINLLSSKSNILYQNRLTTNAFGIYAKDCSNTNITQNTITKNVFHGIYLTGDKNDVIRANFFQNNTVSEITLDSYNCTIEDNIFNRGQIGISLQKTGCQICNNSFQNMSSIAISAIQESKNNIISLNHFLRNYMNAREQGSNQWDDGTKGNYWDTYQYIDRNHDDIGDIPFIVATGGLDRYPVGIFLKPPQKPSNPSPADNQENVGLKVKLYVTVVDVDKSIIPTVNFYNAVNNTYIGSAKNVASGKNASCSLTLPFDTIYAWYTIANDSLQENQSDFWFFTTKQRPLENKTPVANPGGPYITKINQSVFFNGSQSSDPNGTIIFYRWNFGDGSSQILEKTPKHTYTDPGIYIVTLTVVDNDGRSSMANTTATIRGTNLNNPPVAMFTALSSVSVNQQVSFDASGSNDTDGTIVGYRWDFNGDGSFDTDWLNATVTTHAFSSVGSSIVTLEVKDDENATGSFSTTIVVKAGEKKTPGFDIILMFLAVLVGLLIYNKRRK